MIFAFKDTVLKPAVMRSDKYGRVRKERVNFEHDLVSVEAKYHNKFIVSTWKGRPLDKKTMDNIFHYIENNNDCQFILAELKED